MLYTSNISESEQIRYIIYEEEFEDRFPICGEETPEEPGSCDEGSEGSTGPDDAEDADADADADAVADADADADTDLDSDLDDDEIGGEEAASSDDDGKGGGCATAGAESASHLAWLGLALIGARRRR